MVTGARARLKKTAFYNESNQKPTTQSHLKSKIIQMAVLTYIHTRSLKTIQLTTNYY